MSECHQLSHSTSAQTVVSMSMQVESKTDLSLSNMHACAIPFLVRFIPGL